MEIAGKKAIVTGGSRGLGREIALTLKALGASPYVISRTQSGIDEMGREFGIPGAAVDVGDEGQVERFFGGYAAEHGAPDIVINNAGVTADALFIGKKGDNLSKFPLSNWEKVMNVNLTGVFLCAREAAYYMVMRGVRGVIVNISSICRAGNLGQTNYSASKSAVDAMTVTWARELSRFGIRVSSVAPGYVNTDMLKDIRPDVMEKIIANIPVGRLGETDDVAQAVRFVLENDFFNGRILEVDGGMRI